MTTTNANTEPTHVSNILAVFMQQLAAKRSKLSSALLVAVDKGYSVSKEGAVTNKKGDFLKICVHNNGYQYFKVRCKFGSVAVFVHRLQAFQKYGDLIFNKELQVRHLNGNCLDNSYQNIAIGTMSENSLDKSIEVRKNVATIATRANQDKNRSKEIRFGIYKALSAGDSYGKISKHTGVSKSTLSYMKNKSLEYQIYLNENPNQNTV